MGAEIPDPDREPSCTTSDIQKEILLERQFSLAEVIGREGGSFLKGESPIPQFFQAIAVIRCFIDQHLVDSSGAVQMVLHIWVKADEKRVSKHLKFPLNALKEILEDIVKLSERSMLYEFVRQVDVQWGQIYGERPHFQQPGQPPHPEDEYTHESVYEQLIQFQNILEMQIAHHSNNSVH